MKSLRGQLTARLLVSGALLLGLGSAFLYWLICHALTRQFDAALEAKAQWLASMTEQHSGRIGIEQGDTPGIPQTIAGEFFSVRELGGRVVAQSDQNAPGSVSVPAARLDMPVFFDAASSRCVALRFVPREDDEKKAPKGTPAEAIVIFGRDRASLDRTFQVVGSSLLGTCAGVLFAFILVVRWSIGAALEPLDRLGRNVETMNASSLDVRLPAQTLPAELQPITTRLNELFARLEAAFARERRFTDSVAHELRTPLAELRALAEVNLATPATDAERLDSFRDVLAASGRMESLALRLLDLTRTEDGRRALQLERVLVAAALAQAWAPHAARAEKRGIHVQFEVPAEVEISTDAALLHAVFDNLLANAVAHAPLESPLVVRASRSGAAIQLTFENNSGSLTEADVSRLFERFWRKDLARSDSSHHGLGLALAAEFASVLGGHLTARLAHGSRLEFLLTLPAPTES